jgi:tryptophan synthase alpha chain
VLGFGISRPEHARAALQAGAAGVISGSAIVKLIETEPDPLAAVRQFVSEMKAACQGAA